MKKIFISILFFNCLNSDAQVTQCLIDNGIVNPGCNSVGDAYIENTCIAGIQRQIARTVNAEDLAEWIWPNSCWGYNPLPPTNAQINCNPPYDLCYSHFCPDKYCSIIKSFVEIKASFIARAANPWGKAGEMDSNSTYYNSMKQLIIDINASYDCAGLRRPVIQGGIFENCDQSVSNVVIPEFIINEFRNDPGFDNSYYLNLDGSIKQVYFNLNRINFSSGWNTSCPDITKIEARMWFLHCAKIYIDLGFKSIHMGQMKIWDESEINTGYYYAISVLDRIRNYANNKNSFILLTEENFKSLKKPNTNTFLYDFDIRAIRVREISNPQVCGDFNCGTPVNNYLVNSFCQFEKYPGIIDSCVITNSGILSGGYSPLNSCFLPYMPYTTYFDFGSGITPPEGVATDGLGQPCWGSKESVWGWDDTKWFAEKISNNCRKFWIGDAICRLRTYHNSSGFMIAPGLLCVKRPENYVNISNNQLPTSDARYLLCDEPDVKNEVIEKWTPIENTQISISKFCSQIIGLCSDVPIIRKLQNKYRFVINNPDCSSVYTWHIQNPNGTWQPFTYGISREFAPGYPGYYKIYLRQDNLGGFTNNIYYGINEIGYNIYMTQSCCIDIGHSIGNNNQSDENYEGIITGTEQINDFSEFHNYVDNLKYNVKVISNNNKIISSRTNYKHKICLFPNPSSDFIYLDLNELDDKIEYILIYNYIGELIDKIRVKESNLIKIDLYNYINGFYFLKLINANNEIVELHNFTKNF